MSFESTSRFDHRRSRRALLRVTLAVFTAAGAVARPAAAGGAGDVHVTLVACNLPHFSGTLVVSEAPASCAPACPTRRVLTLEKRGGDGAEPLFGVERTYTFRDEPPPVLSCAGGKLTLHWLEQEVSFELRHGALQLAFADRRRLSRFWPTPAQAARSIEAREALGRVLELVLDGVDGRDPPIPGGVDRELTGLVELAATRDHLRAGDFQLADERISSLEHAAPSALPRAVALHVRELRQELDAARLRTLPFSLGSRRAAGTALHPLEGPTQPGSAPALFFRGSELCVVEVGPRSAEAPPDRLMHCFAPGGSPGPSEPRALPPSSGERLAVRDFDSVADHCRGLVVATQRSAPDGPRPCQGVPAQDLLAVLDGDAMLAVADGGLELVRSPTAVDEVSPADARALVARSAGTRLFTRTASYFLAGGLVAQVAGGEEKTWDVLGKPPAGTSWVGTPLVSPDQRWVVAQSGNGDGPVSLWVFPIR